MCLPARALLPRFESKQEHLVPRRETAAKGRCSLPFTSCFRAQRQDQTPSQPLALSPASSQAPRAEVLSITGSAVPLHQCRHSRLRTHTVASPCRLFPFSGSSCNQRDWRGRNSIKQYKIKCLYPVNIATLFSLAPGREPPSHASYHAGARTSGAIMGHRAPALLWRAHDWCWSTPSPTSAPRHPKHPPLGILSRTGSHSKEISCL